MTGQMKNDLCLICASEQGCSVDYKALVKSNHMEYILEEYPSLEDAWAVLRGIQYYREYKGRSRDITCLEDSAILCHFCLIKLIYMTKSVYDLTSLLDKKITIEKPKSSLADTKGKEADFKEKAVVSSQVASRSSQVADSISQAAGSISQAAGSSSQKKGISRQIAGMSSQEASRAAGSSQAAGSNKAVNKSREAVKTKLKEADERKENVIASKLVQSGVRESSRIAQTHQRSNLDAEKEEFMMYIGGAVKPILRALADENEYVRDTALKAGQRIVNLYADSAITLLLPQLESGLFDDNWRIRYSSVQLLGDLLYKISGVSGKMTTETAGDDDNFGTEASSEIVEQQLGTERRNRVLSGLYMGRSDIALMVRQASLHVWKIIVSNTPKTLREILPTLFNLLLTCLASSSYDKRQIAARTLGDLVRKLGERVLPEIIPILEEGLESDDADKRQGVCVGLTEILNSTSRDMIMSFADSLVPTVKKALCDRDPEVRLAAAKTFDALHSSIGTKALDDILPPMLDQLTDPDLHDYTLDGLKQVMAIKSRAVLPYMVPKLTASPVNTKALSLLASVAGESLNKHLVKILPALLTSLADSYGTSDQEKELEYSQTVILSVTDEIGISHVLDILLESCRSPNPITRRGAVTLLHGFCEQTKVDYTEYVPQLIRSLLLIFTDKDETILVPAWNALNSVIKTLDADAQRIHVPDIRQALRFAVSELKEGETQLPGFCLPKGISPVLPVFRESILNGTPEQKEAAVQGLGEIIKVTSAEALKPSVVHITGPLIRILGDRFVYSVKTAVLDTLAILLEKTQAMLKPFLPQLQTTFLKALNDTNRSVRLKAGTALSHLVAIHMRPDPLFNELHTGIKNTHEDPTVKDTYLQALRFCVTKSGDKLSATIRRGVTSSLITMLNHSEDPTRMAVAAALGSLLKWLPEEELTPVISSLLSDESGGEWEMKHGKSTALFIAMQESPDLLYTNEALRAKLIKNTLAYISSDRDAIVCNGVRLATLILSSSQSAGSGMPAELVTPYFRTMNHSSSEVKEVVATSSSILARKYSNKISQDLMKQFIIMLLNGTREKNPCVKSSSELSMVDLLEMRKGPGRHQSIMSTLDPGLKESMQDLINRTLTKVATQQDPGLPTIDNTILT